MRKLKKCFEIFFLPLYTDKKVKFRVFSSTSIQSIRSVEAEIKLFVLNSVAIFVAGSVASRVFPRCTEIDLPRLLSIVKA